MNIYPLLSYPTLSPKQPPIEENNQELLPSEEHTPMEDGQARGARE